MLDSSFVQHWYGYNYGIEVVQTRLLFNRSFLASLVYSCKY
uniref:Uncharacterized protein n=1 Tax=Rhizophora mucronata TaxID=61149 RepID=A0A2P2QNY6_RHIMU